MKVIVSGFWFLASSRGEYQICPAELFRHGSWTMPCHHPIAHKALILLLHASQHHTSEKQAYYNVFIFSSCIINLTLSVGFSGSNLVTCLFDFFTWLAGGKSNWVKHEFFFSFSLLEGRWGRCDNSWLAVGWVYIHVPINQTHPSPQISTLHGVKILRFKFKDNEFLGGYIDNTSVRNESLFGS